MTKAVIKISEGMVDAALRAMLDAAIEAGVATEREVATADYSDPKYLVFRGGLKAALRAAAAVFEEEQAQKEPAE